MHVYFFKSFLPVIRSEGEQGHTAHIAHVAKHKVAETVAHCHRFLHFRRSDDNSFCPIIGSRNGMEHTVLPCHLKALYILITVDAPPPLPQPPTTAPAA